MTTRNEAMPPVPPSARPQDQPAYRHARHAAEPVQAPVHDDEATVDDDRLFSWREVLGYFTPPAPWVTPPASLEELARYAHVGEWASPRGVRRGVGIAYWYTVGLPWTVACRYVEWVLQRPGRLITVLLIGAVLYRTTPGHWVAHALGRIFHFVFLPLTWLF